MADVAHGPVLATASATRASHVELHAAALLRNLSLAIALWTDARAFDVALPVTVPADFQVRDVELHHRALDGLPEAYVDLILEVVARFGSLCNVLLSAAPEDVGEDVAESAGASGFAPSSARAFGEVVEVEAAEVERHFLRVGARSASAWARTTESTRAKASAAPVGLGRRGIDVVGVEPELVVNLPLLGIAEDVVGLRKRFELFLRSLVPGIHVGMILARKLAKRLADIVRGGSLLDPESRVIVFFFASCARHSQLSACLWLLVDNRSRVSDRDNRVRDKSKFVADHRNRLHRAETGRQQIPALIVAVKT